MSGQFDKRSLLNIQRCAKYCPLCMVLKEGDELLSLFKLREHLKTFKSMPGSSSRGGAFWTVLGIYCFNRKQYHQCENVSSNNHI